MANATHSYYGYVLKYTVNTLMGAFVSYLAQDVCIPDLKLDLMTSHVIIFSPTSVLTFSLLLGIVGVSAVLLLK